MCQDSGEKKTTTLKSLFLSFSKNLFLRDTEEKLWPPHSTSWNHFGLKQSVQMSGMDSVGLSVCRDEGSSHRTGDRDRFGCPQVKQEISGGVMQWRLPAGPGRIQAIRKWSSQSKKNKTKGVNKGWLETTHTLSRKCNLIFGIQR